MNCCRSKCKEALGALLAEAGVAAWGVASAEALPAEAVDAYRRWIASQSHGEMAYLERYDDVRSDPRYLLDGGGAVSIISCAFPYCGNTLVTADGMTIAAYAVGEDYHDVLRRRLQPVVEWIRSHGAEARVCVDTAPLRERPVAQMAGVGFIGRNNMLIVPGKGSRHFLAEIVTTLPLEPDEPCRLDCDNCRRCVVSCPGHALDGEMIDCRRCISYLSIEYRGDALPDDVEWGRALYGCDVCQNVCPHNRGIASEGLAEFRARPELAALSVDDIEAMDAATFKRLVKGSAMSRVKLEMLRRNARRASRGGGETGHHDVSSSIE